MKRNLLNLTIALLALLTFVTQSLNAQLLYTRTFFNTTYTPITIGGGATQITGGTGIGNFSNTGGVANTDEGAALIPLPFNFNYAGTTYTTSHFVNVCTNGFITFNTTGTNASKTIAFSNSNLFTTATPNVVIAGWWDDLDVNVGSTPRVLYQTQGTAPNRTFTIQFENIAAFYLTSTSLINFQIILYETTNVIELKYGSVTKAVHSTSESASIGIEWGSGGPGNFIDGITGSSIVGTDMFNCENYPSSSFGIRFTPGAPTSLSGGTYNVGTGQTYPTLTHALADINHRGISGAITLNCTDASYPNSAGNMYPMILGPISGASATNTVTILGNGSGSNAVLSYRGRYSGSFFSNGSTISPGAPILSLVGSDFVTVRDITFNLSATAPTGTPFSTPTNRAIFVSNASATDGATNNTIRDIVVTLDRAVTTSGGIVQNAAIIPSSSAGANSNNKYLNLDIRNVYFGIQLTGNATFPDLNCEIGTTACATRNTIGDPNTANDIGNGTSQTWGIRATNQSGVKIYNNNIRNVTANGAQADGIFLELAQGTSEVYNNIVRGVRNGSTTSTIGIGGISLSHATSGTLTIRVYNNAVSEITSGYTGTATALRVQRGIFIRGTGGATTQTYDIWNNSVSIDGSGSLNVSNACFEISTTSGPVYIVRNNIFANFTPAQGATARHWGIVSTSATALGNTGTAYTHNDVWIANDAGTSGFTALGNTTPYNGVAAWQSAMTQATNNINPAVDPQYVDNNSDLHSGSAALNGVGTTYPTYLTADLECATRTDNDLGAFIINVCNSATGGTASFTGGPGGPSGGCVGLTKTMSVTGATPPSSGITYQWEVSTIGGGVGFTNVTGGSGANTTTYTTGPLTAGTYYYRLRVHCSSPPGFTAYSNEITLTVSAPNVTVTPTSGTFCYPGTGITLNAAGASTYSWSPASGLSSTSGATVIATPVTLTTYTVVGTDANGCTANATSTINALPKVQLTVSATPTSVCPNGNSQLLATPKQILGYSVTSITYAPSPVPGSGVTILAQNGTALTPLAAGTLDDGRWNVTLPFTFDYLDTTLTSVSIGTNGVIMFYPPAFATAGYNNTLPSTIDPDGMFAAMFADLDLRFFTGYTYTVSYWTEGTAPNRRFVVNYNNVGFYNSGLAPTSFATFQAVIGEDGTLETHVALISNTTTGKAIGLENFTGTVAVVPPGRNNAANWGMIGNEAYQFIPIVPTFTYNWSEQFPSPANLSSTVIANPTANSLLTTETYTVTVTGAGGCSATGSATVNVAASATVSLSASPATSCQGTPVTLTATATGGGTITYNWSPSGSGASHIVTLGPGTHVFSVTVTDDCGSTASASTSFTVNPAPPVAVSPTSATYCHPGTGVTLTASGASTYSWSPAAGLSSTSGATVTATPSGSTVYTVTGTDGIGCTATASANVVVSPSVSVTSVTATPPTVCSGGNSNLQVNVSVGTTNSAYTVNSIPYSLTPTTGFTNGPTGDDVISSSISLPFPFSFFGTTYNNIFINTNGQVGFDYSGSTAAQQRTAQTLPSTTLPNANISLCWADLNATTTGMIKYGTVGTAPNRVFVVDYSAVPFFSGGGTVSGQIKLFESSNKIEVHVTSVTTNTSLKTLGIENATGTIGNAAPGRNNVNWLVSSPEAWEFVQPASLTYNWSPATFLSSTTVANPTASGVTSTTTYNVTASLSGCSATGTVTVNVASGATVSLSASPATSCQGTPVTLTATATGGGTITYNWSPSGSGASHTVTLGPGTHVFSVTVTDDCGSTASASTSFTVNPNPTVTVSPSPANYCTPGPAVTITASGATTYSWSPAAGLSSTSGASVDASPSSTTVYTVTGTALGCTGTASVTVNVKQAVSHTLVTSSASPICAGGGATFTVNATGGDNPTPYSSGTIGLAIPDGVPAGISHTINVSGANTINSHTELQVVLNFGTGTTAPNREHTYAGDVRVVLSTPGGNTIVFDRPGVPATTFGNSDDLNGTYTFSTTATSILPQTSGTGSTAGNINNGTYRPSDSGNPDAAHNWAGLTFPFDPNGAWTLTISDHFAGDIGDLVSWSVVLPSGTYTHTWGGTGTFGSTNCLNPLCSNADVAYSNAAVGVKTVTTTGPNGCTVTSNIPVTVNPRPTGNISGTTTICAGGVANLTITLTGTGPWNGTLSDGTPFSGAVSPITVTVSPATTTTYTIATLSDANCAAISADLTGSATVTIAPVCTHVWLGNTNNWHTPTNWSSGLVPNACTHNVQIPSVPVGGNFPVISTADVTVGNINVQQGANVTINAGRVMNVCGNWQGGASSNATVSGDGKVILNGSALQTISGNTRVNNIQLHNTAGANLASGSTFEVNRALELRAGNLNATSGTLVLKSDATHTGYLDNFSAGFTGTYTGNLTIERYIANTADGYRDISAPVNTTVAGLSDDFPIFGLNGVNCWYAYVPYPNVQIYSESANNNLSTPSGHFNTGWISRTGLSNPMGPMVGFAVRTYVGAPYVIDLTGTPRNGPQSITITHTVSATPSEDGWNFVGNPYPSPIDWNDVFAMNTGISNTYYAFNTTGEYTGNWSSWNGTTGVNGGTRNIASMQGFFIKKTAPGSQSFSMNNSVREAESTTVFHKSTSSLPDEIRLELTGNGNSDEIVTYTDGAATQGFEEQHDALKIPAGSTVYISYKLNGKEYAINVIDQVAESTELPLVLWAKDTGLYYLHTTALNLTGLMAFLKDAETNTYTPMHTNNGGIAIPLDGGQVYDGRYSIVFKSEATIANQPDKLGYVRIYSYQNKAIVERSSDKPATITITNVLGQTVKELETTAKRTEIELDNTNPWYAVVKVKEAETIKSAKVLIK
ncbi:MAG: hypothetical protein RML37_02765 [Chitinophagales bacterium]|nr:hypothetical protein [Chitinophagales bacterium]